LPSIDRREWGFVAIVAVVLLTLTTVPYLFGTQVATPDQHFMGLILNVPDHAQYLAWYRGFQGAFLISNRMTPEPNPPIYFNLLWWSLGRLGRYTGLGYSPVYQIFRWGSGLFFLSTVYAFASLFFSRVKERRATLLLTALSSGLGWVLVVLKYTATGGELLFPLDVYIAEGNSFLCLMAYPHFAEAAGFILLTLGLLIVGERRRQLRYAVYAGLAAFLLGWQHGYDLLIVWMVPAAYAGGRWLVDRKLPGYWVKALLVLGAISWPPALYAVLLTRLDPLWEQVLAQFANAGVYTPSLPHLFILFGLPLLVALIAWVRLVVDRRRWRSPLLFVVVWFPVGLLLSYIPTDFQIHMLNSWQVPMMILVTIGLGDVTRALGARWKASSQRWQQMVLPIFLLAILPTNLYLWSWRLVDLNRRDYPYYLYRDEIAAMEWVAEGTPVDAVVLSALETGQYLPALSGRRAFLAHWAQTVDFYDKEERVAHFFDAQADEASRMATIDRFGVDYVFHGPAERALGRYDPSQSDRFSVAFSTPRVTVYRVAPVDGRSSSEGGE
jgi:uncharacterized membrane protein